MVVYPVDRSVQAGFDDLLVGISGEIESHYRGLGRDFYRIRPYEVLESARHLDWKASAHTGTLQVREFAREQERTVEVFLDRNIPPRTRRSGSSMPSTVARSSVLAAFRVKALPSISAPTVTMFGQPEEGDIYTILKYLALVYPQKANWTGSSAR